MNSVYEILEKLPPVLETTIGIFSRNTQLFPLQDATYNLQLGWKWLKLANDEINKDSEDTLVIQSEVMESPKGMIKAPTLLGVEEQFNYLTSSLKTLTKEINEYQQALLKPPGVQYNIDRGYDKLMEALFSIETANVFYNELRKQQ